MTKRLVENQKTLQREKLVLNLSLKDLAVTGSTCIPPLSATLKLEKLNVVRLWNFNRLP
jgi:hypothetical protein